MAGWTDTEFEIFAKESASPVLAAIRRIVRNETDAEDALQETLLAAWRGRESFDGKSSMSTWIHRIAINTALNKLKQVKTSSSKIQLDVEVDEYPDTASHTDDLALRQIVWRAIDQLPEEQRVVLVLRDVEEFSSDEVAERLHLSSDAVRQRLHRARKYIAETLSPELCGADEMTCGGRLDLLLDMIDGMLSEEFRVPVTNHVAGCPNCQKYSAGYTSTMRLPLATAEKSVPIPEGLVRRILHEILAK